MRLNDPLVTSFSFCEKTYPIDLAFDNVLDVFDVLADKELFSKQKIDLVIELLVGETDLSLSEKLDMWELIRSKFILFEVHLCVVQANRDKSIRRARKTFLARVPGTS